MANHFFIIFLATIVITRFFLFFYPIASPTVGKFRMHHYMYGITGVIIGLLSGSMIIYAIGLGLFVDELTYILMRGKSHKDNYSKISIIGTLLFVFLIFFLRDYLVISFIN